MTATMSAIDHIRSFTAVETSGNYRDDCTAGRSLADRIVDDMQATEFPGTLAFVVEELVANGKFGAVQTGFFTRLAELAMRGA